MVGPIQRPAGRLDADAGDGFRGEGQRSAAHHLQPGAIGLKAVEQIETHIGGEPRRPDPEAGESVDIGDPPPCRQAPVRAEPGVGVDRSRPAVGEPDIGELREGDEEVRGEPAEGLRAVLMAGIHPAAEVIDGVVSTPQDPVVRGQPVIVELVGAVPDSLACSPADAVQLGVGEWFGAQDVVVNRNGIEPVSAQQTTEHVGGQHGPRGSDSPRRGGHRDGVAVAPDSQCGGLLVDPHTGLHACAGQLHHQPGGVHDRAVFGEQAGPIRRRIDLFADRRLIEEHALPLVGRLGKSDHLVRLGGHGEHAGALPLDLHAVGLYIALHAEKVLLAQAGQRVDFRGPTGLPVGGAMGETRIDEPAVAARGCPAHPLRLDQNDPRTGIAFGGVQCGPQPGVSPTDDQQVAAVRASQRLEFGPRLE